MSSSRVFHNVPKATMDCWDTNLVSTLKSNGCNEISFSGGYSGSVKFHHSVPSSDGKFAFNYTYDENHENLSVSITDSPWMISDSTILDKSW